MPKKRIKKLSLDWDLPFDYDIFGICSHHPDYRLVWGMNNALGWQLEKVDEPFIPNSVKSKPNSRHSFYEYHDEEDRVDYYLIKNKGDRRLLIEEQPGIDYFLFSNNPLGAREKETISRLNSIQNILATYYFEEEALPSVKNITL